MITMVITIVIKVSMFIETVGFGRGCALNFDHDHDFGEHAYKRGMCSGCWCKHHCGGHANYYGEHDRDYIDNVH